MIYQSKQIDKRDLLLVDEKIGWVELEDNKSIKSYSQLHSGAQIVAKCCYNHPKNKLTMNCDRVL